MRYEGGIGRWYSASLAGTPATVRSDLRVGHQAVLATEVLADRRRPVRQGRRGLAEHAQDVALAIPERVDAGLVRVEPS